jgi:photosystem II stability/assembly factor-like uncharacterized protein
MGMKILKQYSYYKRLLALLSILVWQCIAAEPSLALEDMLVSPAMMTEKGLQSVLMGACRAGDRIVTAGERGHIYYSDNAGSTWTQASVPLSVNLNAVHFPTSKEGWAAGHDGVVLYSDDGGVSWQKQLDGYAAAKISVKAAKKKLESLLIKTCRVPTDDNEANGDFSNDLEMTRWCLKEAERDLSIGPAKPFLDIWFKNEKEGFAIGAFGLFFHTSNGGQTWEDYATKIENPDGMHLYSVKGGPGDAIYIVGEIGLAFRSRDGGDNWETLQVNYKGGLFGVFTTNAIGQVYVYGLRGNVFKSNDFGDSWRRIDTGTASSLFGGLVLNEEKAVFVGQGGTILSHDTASGSCRVVPNDDRHYLAAAVSIDMGTLLVVGMAGAKLIAYNPAIH